MVRMIDGKSHVIEEETQRKIEICVNKHENIIVDAGAGSGKTYSLIELLRNLIRENSETFLYTNQQIMCITYTNAATDEIKERLGESNLVAVSTIHERAWDIIKIYQKQLREIHIEKIKTLHDHHEEELEDNAFYQQYRSREKLNNYFEFLHEDFYNHHWNVQNAKAADIHKEVGDCFTKGELNGNLGKLKEMTKAYYNYYRYHLVLEKDLDEMEVNYNFLSNRDNFLEFEISHDTVLEYGLELIKKDSIFKKVVIDRFPFIVVDEYQDAASDVLEMLMYLDEYAKEKNLSFTIALFGDEMQSIYDNNYSKQVKKYIFNSDNYERISKKFNYRSSKKIIEVGNRIRTDGIKQHSPYTNAESGSVGYKKVSNGHFTLELNELIDKWNINSGNNLNCLMLRNEDIASHLGMENIYKNIKKMNYYKLGANYQLVSQHILSRDQVKLGEGEVAILNILDLYMKIKQDKIYLSDIIPKKQLRSLSIQQATQYVSSIKSKFSTKFKTLNEYLDTFFESYKDASTDILNEIYEGYNHEQCTTTSEFKNFIKKLLKKRKMKKLIIFSI